MRYTLVMACGSSIETLYYVGGWLSTALAVLCWLSSTHRGMPLKAVNFHTVAFGIYVTGVCYGAVAHGTLCESEVQREDAPPLAEVVLARFWVSGTLLGLLSVVATLRMRLGAVDVLVHVAMASLSQLFWYWALVGDLAAHRRYWSFCSVAVAFTLLLHMHSESRARHCPNPAMSRRAVGAATLYMLLYYVLTLLGTHGDFSISLLAQECCLVALDLLTNLFLVLQVVRHAWAEHFVNEPRLRPNRLTELAQQHPDAFRALLTSLEVCGAQASDLAVQATTTSGTI